MLVLLLYHAEADALQPRSLLATAIQPITPAEAIAVSQLSHQIALLRQNGAVH
jgi:hypothetical protein